MTLNKAALGWGDFVRSTSGLSHEAMLICPASRSLFPLSLLLHMSSEYMRRILVQQIRALPFNLPLMFGVKVNMTSIVFYMVRESKPHGCGS